jgi:L-threonylcarbamoyladenylate synthase
MTTILPAISKNIKKASEIIRKGGIVAFPTETVYGLGADAFNSHAVARVFEVKNRPRFDPVIVHINPLIDIEQLCLKIDERAKKLMEKFWPGPLTIILQKSSKIPDIITAGLPAVAVRMPSHPVALELIKEAGIPIAAPSANPFGYLSPTTAEHVNEQIGEKVDLILDDGKCPIGIESTVIDITKKEPILLRPGGLPLEDIEHVIGKVKISDVSPERPHSPGQLPCHYSPYTPIKILENKKFTIPRGKKVGLLAFNSLDVELPYVKVEVLSPQGDLREAAANFFSCLHRLDGAGLDIIFAEPIEEVNLGQAIMERLRRASTKK